MYLRFIWVENLSKIYRTSIENLSKIYRTSIEHRSKIYHPGELWGDFGVTLGSDLAYEGDYGALCEPFRRRKALDGKCDGYMWGLGGAEKRKC